MVDLLYGGYVVHDLVVVICGESVVCHGGVVWQMCGPSCYSSMLCGESVVLSIIMVVFCDSCAVCDAVVVILCRDYVVC